MWGWFIDTLELKDTAHFLRDIGDMKSSQMKILAIWLSFRSRGGWVGHQQSKPCTDLDKGMAKWMLPYDKFTALVYQNMTLKLQPPTSIPYSRSTEKFNPPRVAWEKSNHIPHHPKGQNGVAFNEKKFSS